MSQPVLDQGSFYFACPLPPDIGVTLHYITRKTRWGRITLWREIYAMTPGAVFTPRRLPARRRS